MLKNLKWTWKSLITGMCQRENFAFIQQLKDPISMFLDAPIVARRTQLGANTFRVL